jgi:parvulin-like peptidyl-prolyl isomerase
VAQKITPLKRMALACSILFNIGIMGANAADQSSTDGQPSVFATVGKVAITWQDVETEYKSAAKNKFFHGKPSNDVVAELQRTVADKLITNALILNEANRRKLKPDAKIINQQVADYEAKFTNDPKWPEARARLLPIITKRFESEALVKKLENNVRKVPTPTAAQIQAYYTSHPDKFTAPLEQRVSVILLKVDPSSGADAWEQTIEDAKILLRQIREGEDFAEMAKQYSRDLQTVDQGGDMGYLHEGMLPGLPQETVNKLRVGEVSEPVRLLEGVALFRLTERKAPGLSSFESVKQRAKELLASEESDKAWDALLADLRKSTPMKVDESRFLPLKAADTTTK